jgi:hypothetical protein
MMGSKYSRLNFDKIKTSSISERYSKVDIEDFAQSTNHTSTINQFVESLPNILAAKEFKEFISHYQDAVNLKKQIVWMMGAHTIKCGLNTILINLMQKGFIRHLALNGAGAIHDVEIAIWGKTSEDVASGLQDGSFGMAAETAAFINEGLSKNAGNDLGYAELLGKALIGQKVPNLNKSLLATAYECNIPISLHPALGTEITHQHPNINGPAFGEKSLIDFQIFTQSLAKLSEKSIVLNIGSAVILPEVFLKALTVVRNLGHPAYGFYSAVFDMNRHYRPTENVMQRPTQESGKGYYFIGHHELMLPLLAAALL